MPKRIQRCRTKGWRMPEGSIYVGRPSLWGNPFRIGDRYYVRTKDHDCPDAAEKEIRLYEKWSEESRAYLAEQEIDTVRDNVHAVELFKRWHSYHGFDILVADHLRGHDLVCWCPLDQTCHVDVLLKLANRDLR